MQHIITTPLNIYLELEENYQFPFSSKMINVDEPQRTAFYHIMKTKIEADEHLKKDIREKNGLNTKNVTTNGNIRKLFDQIQMYVCVVIDLLLELKNLIGLIRKLLLQTE
jgi:hypothetical protein